MEKPFILFADDSESDIRLIKEAFKDAQIECESASVFDGVETLEFINKKGRYTEVKTPDLLVLDIKMPKKNGIEVLAEIRTNKMTAELPVVMLTNSENSRDIIEAYEHQANSYITKPLVMAELIEIAKYIKQIWLK